jgi:hypothetical protein
MSAQRPHRADEERIGLMAGALQRATLTNNSGTKSASG